MSFEFARDVSSDRRPGVWRGTDAPTVPHGRWGPVVELRGRARWRQHIRHREQAPKETDDDG